MYNMFYLIIILIQWAFFICKNMAPITVNPSILLHQHNQSSVTLYTIYMFVRPSDHRECIVRLFVVVRRVRLFSQ